MAAKPKTHGAVDNAQEFQDVLNDFEALKQTAQASFARAAKKAIAENDAFGVDSVGTVQGNLTVRKAPKKVVSA